MLPTSMNFTLAIIINVLLLLLCQRTHACLQKLTIPEIISTTYPSQIALIRRGIPSPIVKAFYDNAFQEFYIQNCFCDQNRTTVNQQCATMLFTELDSIPSNVRLLLNYVENDKTKMKDEQFFPHYHANQGGLEALNPDQKHATERAFNHTLQNIQDSFSRQTESRLPNSTFPSDELLLQRTTYACNSAIAQTEIQLPSRSIISYAVGLAVQTYYASGDSSSSLQLLADATQLVYLYSLCASSRDFEIPALVAERFSRRAEEIVKTRGMPFHDSLAVHVLPAVGDIAWIVKVPQSLFSDIITQLSSVHSGGRLRVLKTDGRRIWMEVVAHTLFSVSLDTYQQMLFYFKNSAQINKHLGTSFGGGRLSFCNSGYSYVNRVRQGNSLDNCCLDACSRIEGVLFGVSITREACCEACNMARCGNEETAIGFSEGDVKAEYETVVL